MSKGKHICSLACVSSPPPAKVYELLGCRFKKWRRVRKEERWAAKKRLADKHKSGSCEFKQAAGLRDPPLLSSPWHEVKQTPSSSVFGLIFLQAAPALASSELRLLPIFLLFVRTVLSSPLFSWKNASSSECASGSSSKFQAGRSIPSRLFLVRAEVHEKMSNPWILPSVGQERTPTGEPNLDPALKRTWTFPSITYCQEIFLVLFCFLSCLSE